MVGSMPDRLQVTMALCIVWVQGTSATSSIAKLSRVLPSFTTRYKNHVISAISIMFPLLQILPSTFFILKCPPPVRLSIERLECKDGTTISSPSLYSIYTCCDHVQSSQTRNISQSPSSNRTPPPSPHLSPFPLDLLHRDVPSILDHLLALLNSPWKCLIRRFALLGRCCYDPSRIEHHQPQQLEYLPTVPALLSHHLW
jgi:hypothetical protein